LDYTKKSVGVNAKRERKGKKEKGKKEGKNKMEELGAFLLAKQ